MPYVTCANDSESLAWYVHTRDCSLMYNADSGVILVVSSFGAHVVEWGTSRKNFVGSELVHSRGSNTRDVLDGCCGCSF